MEPESSIGVIVSFPHVDTVGLQRSKRRKVRANHPISADLRCSAQIESFERSTIASGRRLSSRVPIDGPGKILGQAGPTHLRPASGGTSAFLPEKGLMSFATADLAKIQADVTDPAKTLGRPM
jgi:hypothetical protein